jgi:Zn-finger nucleic acid-binding protein
MNCPRDHHELTDRLFEDFPIHKCLACFGFWVPKNVIICPACRGIWMDRGEFDSATFRERTGWTAHQEPEDSYLRLFVDTIAYTSELSGELIWFNS